MEMQYASHAVGTAGLTTGIIGTALGALNGAGGLMGVLGVNGAGNNQYVRREEFEKAMVIAAKDSEIALLKSESNTENKITDVYERITTRLLEDERNQAAVNAQQAVYNGTNTAMIGCLQNQVNQLMSLTALKIPNSNIFTPAAGSSN